MKQIKIEATIIQSLQQIDRDFRGSLIFKTDGIVNWKLYFRLGHCSWMTGGSNSLERLQRHLALYCPQITPSKLKEIATNYHPTNERSTLIALQKQGLIERQEIARLMTSNAIEVLFDMIQYAENNSKDLTYEIISEGENYNLCLLLPILEFKSVFDKAKNAWQEWQKAGLKTYSPNLYPVVKQPNILNKKIANEREKQVVSSIDGKQTLRGIALKSKIKTINLTRFLSSLVAAGIIDFAKVPQAEKIKLLNNVRSPNNILNQTKNKNNSTSKTPLVVCVDDSPLICKALEQIVVNHNYRYISIQESMKVIPLLLRNKPNFIFLDLMMPVVNGYELCTQLRRAPSFKDVPIVILTGKDGLVDRMRAKLAGSTDFMSKPVEESAVLNMLDKHLTIRR